MKNNKQKIIYIFILFCICILLLLLYNYKYSVEKFNTLYTITDVSNASTELIMDISQNIKDISDNLTSINTEISNNL